MTAGRICCVCDQTVTGEANVVVRHSASGVRLDVHSHRLGDPACIPRRNVDAMLAQATARRP